MTDLSDLKPTKENAMILGDELSDTEAVYQALGAASVCWEPMDGTGIFQSDRCKQIGDELMERLNKPRLGYATTRDLLAELTARAEVDGVLDYRTVDSD